MTTIELLNRLKTMALAQFAQEQEAFIRFSGPGVHRNPLIDARMAAVRGATKVGDVLQVMIKFNEATVYDDDAPAFRRLPNSAEHERVYWFILRAVGATDLTLEDVRLRADYFDIETWRSGSEPLIAAATSRLSSEE